MSDELKEILKDAFEEILDTLAFCLRAIGIVVLVTLAWGLTYRLFDGIGLGGNILDTFAVVTYVLIVMPVKFYQIWRILHYKWDVRKIIS